ncbi:MAG: hypothetical protein JKY02_07540 [Flavobacteriaceae bacterium]|nr:hypothetical protein [Flavobacteriaceae bacterium]
MTLMKKTVQLLLAFVFVSACQYDEKTLIEGDWYVSEFEINGEDAKVKSFGEELAYIDFDEKGYYEIFKYNNISVRHTFDKGLFEINTSSKTLRLKSFEEKDFDILLNYSFNGQKPRVTLQLKGDLEEVYWYIELR